MVPLDVKKINQCMLKHQQLLQHVSTNESLEQLNQKITIKTEEIITLIQNLDRAELVSLKRQLTDLYSGILQLQVALNQGQNLAVVQAFVLRIFETELLPITSLKEQLPEALSQLQGALEIKDLARSYLVFGAIIGATMNFEELFGVK